MERRRAKSLVANPPFAIGLLILLLNDEWLKKAFPGVITGKLSDFAGLFVFPLLIAALTSLIRPALARPVLIYFGSAAAVVFLCIKCSRTAAIAYGNLLGLVRLPFHAVASIFDHQSIHFSRVLITVDTTDLIALPIIALAIWYGQSRINRQQTSDQRS